MTIEPELDVVIVNYNSGQALEQCVNQLVLGSGIDIHVSIVDNNSFDNSLSFVEDLDSSIKLIKNQSNTGFSIACNQGAKIGGADQIAFINPDCFISRVQLAQLYTQLAQYDSAALIGCKVLNEDGSLQAATRRRLPTFWRIIWHLSGLSKWSFFKGVNINDSGTFDDIQTVEAVNGSCVLVKRQFFEQLGGFDEAYPLHFEDLDLFARLQTEQYSILYDASVVVKHLKGNSTQDCKKIKAWKRQGLLRYLLKHRPRWEYLMAKFLLALK